jgi:cell division protein FtsB
MLIDEIERIKKLVAKIHALEDKLMNTSFMPMAEQKKLHDEIRALKDEMDMLEKRTRRKG